MYGERAWVETHARAKEGLAMEYLCSDCLSIFLSPDEIFTFDDFFNE